MDKRTKLENKQITNHHIVFELRGLLHLIHVNFILRRKSIEINSITNGDIRR